LGIMGINILNLAPIIRLWRALRVRVVHAFWVEVTPGG
jgi:hypothetical protein